MRFGARKTRPEEALTCAHVQGSNMVRKGRHVSEFPLAVVQGFLRADQAEPQQTQHRRNFGRLRLNDCV